MAGLTASQPMHGCQVVVSNERLILFGQPPEVLKALLKKRLGTLEALVLPDVRERTGSLLNNIEFLLYYFLFFEDGLHSGRRLTLIGDVPHIEQVLELLRLTLLGPSESEFDSWGTEAELKSEWVNSGLFFALKNADGDVRDVASFFDIVPFVDNQAEFADYAITRRGVDQFVLTIADESIEIALDDEHIVAPPYQVTTDYVASGLVKFGVEVLGGASGFSPEQPSTGFALCFNGNYVLIDAIPYVDWHLKARGISRNQVNAVFLTHLHDDHCNMFPLMLMPHKLDVITTREIFEMAIRKLAMGLGWAEEAIAEHFNFVEIRDGQTLNYYGMEIDSHHPVHSIPTVGAVFRATWQGRAHEICLVGDIQTFAEIGQMREQGLVRTETEDRLHELYRRRFDLLIADGGMGPIHGDPADALGSQAERVVFVHVEKLPEQLNATFSLASSGKRYVVLEGDSDIYITRSIEFLMRNFRRPLVGRWLSTLFADKMVKRYNTDDVIIKQGSETWGSVFLILTGYCEVIHHDGERFSSLATREAGDLMGEMAVVTGSHERNASVVARTPVMVCEFSEETFSTFLEEEGLKDELLSGWARRSLVVSLPQFTGLSTTVIDALCVASEEIIVGPGERFPTADEATWDLVCSGSLREKGADTLIEAGTELGAARPYARPRTGDFVGKEWCTVLRIREHDVNNLLLGIPQLNYSLRKYRAADPEGVVDWLFADEATKGVSASI
ncbi:MAG: hypothetical protein ACI8PT_001112 [Gammaproteobacteria bacterium]|jgi:hypothetical protein